LKIWISKDKSEQLLTLNLGNQNPDKSGYYGKLENSPDVLLLENFALFALDKDLFYFRDKNVFKIKETDVIQIYCRENNKIYQLNKKNQNWIAIKPIFKTNIKIEEINKILLPLIDIKVKKYYDEEKIEVDKTGLLSPNIEFGILDNNKKEYVLLIGKEIKNEYNYYAKLKEKELIFAVDRDVINDLKKNFFELTKISQTTNKTNK
jgi:hypothetical protein